MKLSTVKVTHIPIPIFSSNISINMADTDTLINHIANYLSNFTTSGISAFTGNNAPAACTCNRRYSRNGRVFY